jgi:hypothetical protein
VQPGHQRRDGRDHRPDPGRGREPGPADLLGRPAPQARPPEPDHRQRHPGRRLAPRRPGRRGRRARPGVPVRAPLLPRARPGRLGRPGHRRRPQRRHRHPHGRAGSASP